MEHKIEMVLTTMGGILSGYYPPSHARLYALRRLGIDVPKVHHKLRKKELTDADRKKLKNLFQDLNRYIEYYGVDDKNKYYVNLWQQSLVDILNGA